MFTLKKYAVFAAASLAALAISCSDDSEDPTCEEGQTLKDGECVAATPTPTPGGGTPLTFKTTALSNKEITGYSGKSRGDVSTGTTYSSTEFTAAMDKINVIGGGTGNCGDAVYAPGFEDCSSSANVINSTSWYTVESADEASFKSAANVEDLTALKTKYNKELAGESVATAIEKVGLAADKIFLVDYFNTTSVKDEMWVVIIEEAKTATQAGTDGSSVKLKSYKLGEWE
jgi:hypothetical protein